MVFKTMDGLLIIFNIKDISKIKYLKMDYVVNHKKIIKIIKNK